jgi:dienelactone hydrolase
MMICKYIIRILFFLLTYHSVSAQLVGLVITGNPTDINGATFTYQNTIDGVTYELKGFILRPNNGNSIHPAVIINHGTGGNTNPNTYAHNLAKKMVTWGYVCIAVNLTHSANVPIGSPGTNVLADYGASLANRQRSMKCWDILESLSYVDTTCISVFGHSRGAFLTTALAGTFPNKFKTAGHTAGGVDDTLITMPSTVMANGITMPYIFHHSINDNVVNISFANYLDSILTNNNIIHQYYNDYTNTHSEISLDNLMLQRTQAFFATYGCSNLLTTNEIEEKTEIIIYPNPTKDIIKINNLSKETVIEVVNSLGQIVFKKTYSNHTEIEIDFSKYSNGIYYIKVIEENTIVVRKIIKK